MKTKTQIEAIASEIVDSCFHVHKEMGPSLLESIYILCLVKEFHSRNVKFAREVYIPLIYKGEELAKDFRLDLLVEDEIIIEVKAVDIMHPVFDAQVISYLKLTNLRLAFLVNFNVPLIKNGIKRLVNNF